MKYVYRSTDPGAPTKNGLAGSLITVLDAVLLTGYGAINVTSMTRTGSEVTVTTDGAHGFDSLVTVQISGASEADYNGKWRIASAPTTTTFTFDIGTATPSTPATGTVTAKIAPMGWTKEFPGTNKAAYKMPVLSNGHYLRVNDTIGQYAIVNGYETMSDVDTGTVKFPNSDVTYWKKSRTADATAREWWVIGDDKGRFWLLSYISPSSLDLDGVDVFFFGAHTSLNAADAWNTVLASSGNTNTSYSNYQSNVIIGNTFNNAWGYACKDFSGVSNAQKVGSCGVSSLSTSYATNLYPVGGSQFSSPSVPSNIVAYNVIAPYYETDLSLVIPEIRGIIPGWYLALYIQKDWTNGDVLDEFVGLEGKLMMGFRTGNGSQSYQVNGTLCFVDVSPEDWV